MTITQIKEALSKLKSIDATDLAGLLALAGVNADKLPTLSDIYTSLQLLMAGANGDGFWSAVIVGVLALRKRVK